MNVSPIEALLVVGILIAIGIAIFLRTPKGQALEAKGEAAYADLHTKVDQLLAHAKAQPAQAVDHAAIIQAAASVVAAAQPQATVTDKLLGGAPAIPVAQPPAAAPAPAAAAVLPTENPITFAAFDGNHPNGAVGPKKTLVLNIGGAPAAQGCTVSATRASGSDAQLVFSGSRGVQSGTANDWNYSVPAGEPLTLTVTADVDSIYGFAVRPGA